MNGLKYGFLLAICFVGCSQSGGSPMSLPTFTPEGFVRTVIEIPAGTNHKIVFDSAANTFRPLQKDGQDFVVSFLPYPVNHGFIPSTQLPATKAQGNSALPVMVLAESLPTGISIAVKPLALIKVKQNQDTFPLILSTPAYPERRIIPDTTLNDLHQNKPAVKEIISMWLKHCQSGDNVEVLEWQSEEKARRIIEDYRLKKTEGKVN